MKLLPLLCLCLLAPSAAANGPAVYKVVKEGEDVTLPCSLSSRKDISKDLFDWKKDPFKLKHDEVFLYDAGVHYNNGRSGQSEQFRGRVWHFREELKRGNASINIRNTKLGDSGNYTCDFPRLRPPQKFQVELVVVGGLKDRRKEKIQGAASEPYVTSLKETKDWSLLQCIVKDADPEPRLEWQDSSGNKVPAKDLQVLGRDFILQTTVTKSGHYYCVATQETINHQIRAGTDVYIVGTVSEPSVTSIKATKYSFLLQCVVKDASPKPRLEWQDSSGNILATKEPQVLVKEGSYDIILKTTVTKTDHYYCVATQEAINLKTQAEIDIYIPKPPIGTVAAAIVISSFSTLLVVGAVLVVLVTKGYLKINVHNTQGQSTETNPTQHAQSETLIRQS